MLEVGEISFRWVFEQVAVNNVHILIVKLDLDTVRISFSGLFHLEIGTLLWRGGSILLIDHLDTVWFAYRLLVMGAVLASFQNLLIMLLVLLVSAFKLDGVVLLDVFDDFGEGFFLDALEV